MQHRLKRDGKTYAIEYQPIQDFTIVFDKEGTYPEK